MMRFNPPTNPGCYIYKNEEGKIIYVGKAKNLKKRVSSYFNKNHDNIKTKHLVSHIKDAEFIITDNEVEALLLENTLIKKHKPKYNIDLKNSDRYAYIKVTNEEYPKIMTARRKNEPNAKHIFGPLTQGYKRKQVVDYLVSTFKLRTCKHLPKKVCLKYHLNLCKGPCEELISKEEYNQDIKMAVEVLKGNTSNIVKKLKEEMKIAADDHKFEDAKELRDKAFALEHLSEAQKFEKNKLFNQDIINYKVEGEKANFLVFNIDKGTILNKKDFSFDVIDEDVLDQFVKQYYSINEIPKEIILPHHLVDEEKILEYLESLSKYKIEITVPKIGDKKKLLELVSKNIDVTFGEYTNVLSELQRELSLPKKPVVMECFDISNLGATNVCASMVQFRNGKSDKSNYRKYKMKTVVGQDDFASMKEVLYRRYSKLETFPDLIIVDGGPGQLSSAQEVLEHLDINIPLISLAKKEELVYGVHLDEPVAIPHSKESLKLLQRIRNEAHRFVITYQRKLREIQLRKEFEK